MKSFMELDFRMLNVIFFSLTVILFGIFCYLFSKERLFIFIFLGILVVREKYLRIYIFVGY